MKQGNTMLDTAITEYLAKGGTITRIPPGAAEYGHSVHMDKPVLPPSSCLQEGVTIHAVIQQFFDLHKAKKERKKARSKTTIAQMKASKVARCAAWAAAYNAGETIDQLAARLKVTTDHIRQSLRFAGVDLPTNVQVSNAFKRPEEVVALYLAGGTLASVALAIGANQRSVRAVLAERGVTMRGMCRKKGE